MNKRSTRQSDGMNELQQELFEKHLRSLSQGLEYPRTPDVAGSVMTRLGRERGDRGKGDYHLISRRFAWSLTIILILCSSLMLIPPARAAIIEFIHIGVDRIFPQATKPTIQVITTATSVSTIISPPPTPSPAAEALLPILRQIAGETTLADAQKKAGFPILLPTYPYELGLPDNVYIQDLDGNMIILVWLDPQHPSKILMSLHFIPNGSWTIDKLEPKVIQETKVNGQRAIWVEGPYPLMLRNGNLEFTRLVDGHVLIWVNGKVTYRLETDLSLEETVKIAESLEPIR